MSERQAVFLALYERYRLQDQREWYHSRGSEFRIAQTQVIVLTGILLVVTMLFAVFGSADILGWRKWWIAAAIVSSMLSSALTAFGGLYAFERQSKLYQDAANILTKVSASQPLVKPSTSEQQFQQELSEYVEKVEGVFRRERAQWGQLISEIERVPITEF